MDENEIKKKLIAFYEQEAQKLRQELPYEKPHPRAGLPGYCRECWTSRLFEDEIAEEMAEQEMRN